MPKALANRETVFETVRVLWIQGFKTASISEKTGVNQKTIRTADLTDLDSDGLNNWQEWTAGTNPTNATSVLLLASPSKVATGLKVSWQSVNTRTYFLQRSTNLLAQPAFSSVKSNIFGQSATTIYNDTTATNSGPYFYRVGVQ